MFDRYYYDDITSEFPEECGDYYVWAQGEEKIEDFNPSILRIFEISVRNVQEQAHYMKFLNRFVELEEKIKMVSFFSVYFPKIAEPIPYESHVRSIEAASQTDLKIPGSDFNLKDVYKRMRYAKIPKFEPPTLN